MKLLQYEKLNSVTINELHVYNWKLVITLFPSIIKVGLITLQVTFNI